VRSPLRQNFSQQGRKGHKEGFRVSDLCGLCGLVVEISVCLLSLRLALDSFSLGATPALCDLVELPIATNRLAIAKCGVQLFNGDVAGYSEQKVRSIGDIDIGTIPINRLLDAGVVQIRILGTS
jgi:hypothetical protein